MGFSSLTQFYPEVLKGKRTSEGARLASDNGKSPCDISCFFPLGRRCWLRDRKKVPKGGSHRCWAVSQMEGSDQRARKGEVGVRASV